MGRPCTTCEHPARGEIDRELVAGAHYRDIAGRYSLNKNSVHRHKLGHISSALVKAAERREKRRGSSLLDRVESLIDRLEVVVEREEAKGNSKLSILALRELRSTLALLGHTTGELKDQPSTVVNVLQAPDWLVLRAAIEAALAPYPEARAAVASAVLELEARPSTTVERLPDRAVGGS